MSWGFGGVAANGSQGVAPIANAAPDLEAIETEQLGFQALDGERKVRLFTSPWPSDALPSKTASLLAIANQHRLLAAAGPDSLILYDTDAIRSAFKEAGKEKLVHATAKATTSTPRLSHLAFTSDESALAIAAETGGGLAIYDVSAANTASTWSPSYQISTEGTAVRHLLPNPNAEASHLLAVVLADGKLLLADLKSRSFISGSSGSTVLKDNVSCASWSKKGKQIVVGLADGTAVQLDTQGSVKDSIPRPPSLPADQQLPITAISWLENLEFLLIHAPVASSGGDGDGMASISEAFFHLALRDKDTKVCSYHRFVVDPCPPFMDERLPAHHYIQRIREWQPNLDDSLIIACTASTDIGVLTRSKKPLSQDLPAEQITHTYTTTSFTDTRRAALPMAVNDVDDTFPIGMVVDLSSQQKVTKPIPNDETIDESDTPLPELCVLNQEGVLSAWWYVYNEAVRAKQAAPGMGASTQPLAPMQPPAPSTPGSSGFGGMETTAKPSFGQASTPQFGQLPSTSTFGKPSFGSTSTPGFGAPSGLGGTASPWAVKTDAANTTTSTTSKTTFGAPSQLGQSSAGSGFGQTANLSFGKPSVWGSGGQTATTSQIGSTFGQPSQPFGGAKADNPFAAFAKQHRESQSNTGASPFAGFAQGSTGASPFASFNTQSSKLSPFATQGKPGMPNETSFGSTVTLNSNSGSFGSASTFAPSRFGQPSEVPEAAMQDSGTPRDEKKESSAFGGLGGFKLGSTFKPDGSASTDLPPSKSDGKSLFGSKFGNLLSPQEMKPEIKEEPTDSQQINLKDIPEAPATTTAKIEPIAEAAPLPPDFTSTKTTNTEDAPLPPDFLSKPKADEKKAEVSGDDIPLPPDFLAAKASTSAETKLPTPPSPTAKQSQVSELPLPSTQSSPDGPKEDDSDSQDWDGVSEGDGEEQEEDASDDGAEDEDDDEGDDDDDQDAEGEWEEESDDSEAASDDGDRTPKIVNPERLSAFTSRITQASPEETKPEKESTTPETAQKPSFTPAGFPKASVNFAPPRTTQESPRSPSPVRTDRAVTSPMRFQHQQSSFQPAPTQQSAVPNPKLKASTGNARASLFQSKPTPQSIESLEDEDDFRMQQILKAPIKPSRTLPDFIAHQDYTGSSNKDGISGQLEKVYRDINSMIDTIGLNARALQAFVQGHSPTSKDKDISRDDLEDPEDWAIGDVYALETYQVDIGDRLESGKLTDITDKVDEILEQDEQLARLSSKAAEVRKQISLRTDPQKRAQQQAAALPTETAAQQTELRRSVQNVQKLLAQVEEGIVMLRAALASRPAASSDANGTTVRPSVENVTRVIEGLTAQIERKSGDVDLLEAQIKKLPGGISALGMSASYEDGLIDSLTGSKLSNGQTNYSASPRRRNGGKADALGMSGMLGSRLQASVSSLRQSTTFDPAGSMLGRSTASLPGSARKKMADVTSEEVEGWKAKAAQRRSVLQSLRRVVEESGAPRVVTPDQIDA